MIVIINGAPGSGKTKTAEYLLQTIPNCAWIDGDWMLRVNPQNRTDKELQLRQQNIAAVAKNYHDGGYAYIFISFVYLGPKSLSAQKNMLHEVDNVKVIALVSDGQTLRNRHISDTYSREDIDSSIEMNSKIARLEKVKIIDNSNLTIEETGNQIIEVLGLK